jgi:hypothetical protein
MTSPDPRKGLASASIMARLESCPGSLAFANELRSLGKYYELPNPYAATGTRIHQYLALERVGKYTEAEQALPVRAELTLAQKCVELREEMLTQWLKPTNGNEEQPVIEFQIEKRLWYRNGLWPRFSGQPDFIAIDRTNKRAIILDYKSGRKENPEVQDNLQLRCEAVLLKHVMPELTEISGAIIEPLVSWDSVSVRYNAEALQQAENQILAIVDATEWRSQERISGTWCQYCPARLNCPEARGYIESIPKPPEGKLMVELPKGEAGTALWRKIQVAEKLLKDMEAAYQKMLEESPECLPGLVLPEQGKERRIIAHPDRLKAMLSEFLTEAECDGCASYHPMKLQELLGLKLKLSGRELEKLFERLTKGVIETIHDRPFVRERTKREREQSVKIIDAREALAGR